MKETGEQNDNNTAQSVLELKTEIKTKKHENSMMMN